MENSILTSTKKILQLDEAYTVYDMDICVFINTAFSTLTQLGIGPAEGFTITDALTVWDDYPVSQLVLNTVRTYVFLRVRMLFDPPTLSFLLEAMKQQITEFEIRLNVQREWDLDPFDPMTTVEEEETV